MKASEFVSEAKKKKKVGNLHKEQQSTMNRAHKFGSTADRVYDLNRTMMAVACSDGQSFPYHGTNEESWVGRYNISNPYTELEHQMLHHAYKTIGVDIEDVVKNKAEEPDATNNTSPIKSFKGYKRK